MTRLTKEREQEIREALTDIFQTSTGPESIYSHPDTIKELLEEIDSLRASLNNHKVIMYQDLTKIEELQKERDHYEAVWEDAHVIISEVEKERDALRAEILHLIEERDALKAELELSEYGLAREKETQKLRERVAALRLSLSEIADDGECHADEEIARRALAADDVYTSTINDNYLLISPQTVKVYEDIINEADSLQLEMFGNQSLEGDDFNIDEFLEENKELMQDLEENSIPRITIPDSLNRKKK